jgi:secreted trypsin-like serine protease
MSLSVKVSLALILILKLASGQQFNDCGKREFGKILIANGKNAVQGQFPWHAALMFRREVSYQYLCGASIITEKHLISGETI